MTFSIECERIKKRERKKPNNNRAIESHYDETDEQNNIKTNLNIKHTQKKIEQNNRF